MFVNEVKRLLCILTLKSMKNQKDILNNSKKTPSIGAVQSLTKKASKRVKVQETPSSIELIALGSGFHGTSKCLIVNTTHFKYMFNCGEGTQRVATEFKRLRGVNRIFATHDNWSNLGGLIGLSLTLEAADIGTLYLHGPENMQNHVTASKYFSKLKNINIVKEEFSKLSHNDTAMRIDFIPVYKSHKNPPTTTHANNPTTTHTTNNPTTTTHILSSNNDAIEDDDDDTPAKKLKLNIECISDKAIIDNLPTDMAVAYLCKPHPKARKVDLEKCVEHNVPVGPLLAVLKEGKEVEVDGRVIHPDQVLSEEEPNKPFLIMECPSIDHLYSITTSPLLETYYPSSSSSFSSLAVVVHFTPSSVMKHPQYQSWMRNLGTATDHIILNDLSHPLDSEACHKAQHILNTVHPTIFPLLPFTNHVMKDGFDDGCGRIVQACTNVKYSIRPPSQPPFSFDQCIKIDKEKYTKEIEPPTTTLTHTTCSQSKGVQLAFLGTGSAVPNKYRNVSCILLNIDDNTSIMLDCGENSMGQLYRHYGAPGEKSGKDGEEMMKRLKMVMVSHLHADHHLGLVGLALRRYQVLRTDSRYEDGKQGADKLIVVAPRALYSWYKSIDCSGIPLLQTIHFVAAEDLLDSQSLDSQLQSFMTSTGINLIKPVRVRHAQHPFGFVVGREVGGDCEQTDAWKVVYSGDTMPCEALVEAGMGCDLLIHEATFDADKEEEAEEKKHSTSHQAINIGRRMQAKFTLLTHFSQRYDKLPLFTEEFDDKVGVAFDNMEIKLKDLAILPTLVPHFKRVYKKEYEEMLMTLQDKELRKKNAEEKFLKQLDSIA